MPSPVALPVFENANESLNGGGGRLGFCDEPLLVAPAITPSPHDNTARAGTGGGAVAPPTSPPADPAAATMGGAETPLTAAAARASRESDLPPTDRKMPEKGAETPSLGETNGDEEEEHGGARSEPPLPGEWNKGDELELNKRSSDSPENSAASLGAQTPPRQNVHVFASDPASKDVEMPDSSATRQSPPPQPEEGSLSSEKSDPMDASTVAPESVEGESNEEEDTIDTMDDTEPAATVDDSTTSTEGAADSNNDGSEAAEASALDRKRPADVEVIDLQGDDGDDDDDDNEKSDATDDLVQAALRNHIEAMKRQKTNAPPQTTAAAVASYRARASNMPEWMLKASGTSQQSLQQSSSAQTAQLIERMYQPVALAQQPSVPRQPSTLSMLASLNQGRPTSSSTTGRAPLGQAEYIRLPEGFKPTWEQLMPALAAPKQPPSTQPRVQLRSFQLSLLNVNEFTITGLPTTWDGPPTPISGLRVPIRQVSRGHGKAVYERDNKENGGGGKWRIPLGAYHAFFAYLVSDPNTKVEGIPQNQLQIASLERARQEKGYPAPEKLMEVGVPKGLANALAPFQRGGVDFVSEKNGRALIADDMGLGKTIQGIASMSIYHKEWPLLVLCPSGARYHWESEFRQWLGVDSPVNKEVGDSPQDSCDKGADPAAEERLLQEWQVHVLINGNADILPFEDTKVVICSYGLAPGLVESGRIRPGLFRCAIVDESHMLKNKSTKRTSALLPVLQATTRCVLLSGTPALARPSELWPQLAILGTEKYGWWDDEGEFMDKYVRHGGPRRRAELHTMLTGTIMIRRLKNDILKTLPSKNREKAEVHVVDDEKQREEFKGLLAELRQSKGALGKLARKQHEEDMKKKGEVGQEAEASSDVAAVPLASHVQGESVADINNEKAAAEAALHAEVQQRLVVGLGRIQQLHTGQPRHLVVQVEEKFNADLRVYYQERMNQIYTKFSQRLADQQEREKQENKRTTLLTRLYGLTGTVKIPLVVEMLKRWLDDPTKGKVCIFAHHISVLNAIEDLAGLSNGENSTKKFIRIDGSTSPKHRQQQITAFQTDPSIRVAVLGITAAGVAVTLTAASNVWFAELFWTPAIMIQAEDRCHRIGQQARVNCLYFVAKGTLDEFLWKLIEKKFRDLGEFVEGREKQKIVVDKSYGSKTELFSMFGMEAVGSDEEEMDEANFGDDELQMDRDLVHDIEELGEEERKMLRLSESDNEEESSGNEDSKPAAVDGTEDSGLGRSEEDAIMLLEDDDEEPAKPPAGDAGSSKASGVDQTTPEESQESGPEEPSNSEAASTGASPPNVDQTPSRDSQPVGPEEPLMSNAAKVDPADAEQARSSGTKEVDPQSRPQKDLPSRESGESGAQMQQNDPPFSDSQKSEEQPKEGDPPMEQETPKPPDAFADTRLYRILHQDSKLGIEITLHRGRLVVAGVSQYRIDRFGAHAKPSVGDILVGLGGQRFSLQHKLMPVLYYIKHVLQRPPVELIFAESPSFAIEFKKGQEEFKRGQAAAAAVAPLQKSSNQVAPTPAATNEVIDLIDDSD